MANKKPKWQYEFEYIVEGEVSLILFQIIKLWIMCIRNLSSQMKNML